MFPTDFQDFLQSNGMYKDLHRYQERYYCAWKAAKRKTIIKIVPWIGISFLIGFIFAKIA